MKKYLLITMILIFNGIIAQGQSFVDGNYKFTVDYITDLTTGNQYRAIDYVILQSSLNKITVHHPNGKSDMYNIISKEKGSDLGSYGNMEYHTVFTGTGYNFQFSHPNNTTYKCWSTSDGGMWIEFHIVKWQNY